MIQRKTHLFEDTTMCGTRRKRYKLFRTASGGDLGPGDLVLGQIPQRPRNALQHALRHDRWLAIGSAARGELHQRLHNAVRDNL